MRLPWTPRLRSVLLVVNVTVMLLPHVPVARREKFSENGLNGVLLPAGTGSVAVLARGASVEAADVDALVSAVRWAR